MAKIIFYDLIGRNGARFSPHCWRVTMVLAAKKEFVDVELHPLSFRHIKTIADKQRTMLPAIHHDGNTLQDSLKIAQYLDQCFPESVALVSGAQAPFARYMHYWAATQLQPRLFKMIVADIWQQLQAEDQAYFRQTREQRLGQSLEAAQEDREEKRPELIATLAPFRGMLKEQAYLGGAEPNYADYVLFSALQWHRVSSGWPVLRADEADIQAWFDRCLDLHDGLGRRESAFADRDL